MTTKDEALKLALEALDVLLTEPIAHKAADRAEYLLLQAAPAIREALAKSRSDVEQPAQQQEPVAWKDKTYGNLHHQDFGSSIPLYTSPPASKPFVGLTDEEIDECYYWKDRKWTTDELVRYVEAKLRDKNA